MLHPYTVIAIGFQGLFCLAPVALYLCWLSAVNRRSRPTVVAGAWDFAGVLAALSGFLVVGGVVLLSVVQNDPRLFTSGDYQQLRAVFETQWLAWLAVFVGYAGVIVIVALTGVRRRARTLSVYNVDANTAEVAVESALAQAGLTAVRTGNLWADQRKLVELLPFHGTRHATVRLLCPHTREREEIERHLRAALVRTASPDNPASAWLTLASGMAVLTVVLFVGVLLYIMYVPR